MIFLYLLCLIVEIYVFVSAKYVNWKSSVKILLVGTILALLIQLVQMTTGDDVKAFLTRTEADQGKKTWQLNVSTEDSSENIQIKVDPKVYKKDEIPDLLEKFKNELDRQILGKNESLDYVTQDLQFIQQIKGYPFVVSWKSDHMKVLGSDGKVGKGLNDEGTIVEITANITEDRYQTKEIYRFSARVFPQNKEEAFFERLENLMVEKESQSNTEEKLPLPKEFEGRKIIWSVKGDQKSNYIFLLGIFSAIGIHVAQKKEKERKKEERQKKIVKTYPELVTRMTMLASAGMTIIGAFRKIASDYERRKDNPLYEEMQITCREMESGISEEKALQNMGIRCGQSEIIKLNSLLIRFMKSGSKGIRQSLKEEMMLAMKDRKSRAIKLGEEAGTKMLLPMVMMLVVVMVMIMTPAFTSFG